MSVATVAHPGAEMRRGLDEESRTWLADLRSKGSVREAAVEQLHALLLRAAHFEVARRRPTLPNLRGNELDDIAMEAADDAPAILAGAGGAARAGNVGMFESEAGAPDAEVERRRSGALGR